MTAQANFPEYPTIQQCPECKAFYTTQDACPSCGLGDPRPTQQAKTSPKRGLAVVSGVNTKDAPEKPPKKEWTKTTLELAYPVVRHGAMVHYVRWYAKSRKAKKDYDRFYVDAHWFSILELQWWQAWKATGYPMPIPEYKFHPEKNYRFDFCFVEDKVGVELEGGIYSRGRHVRGDGYKADLEKYNAAAELGWLVLRYADVRAQHIEQIKRVLGAKDIAA